MNKFKIGDKVKCVDIIGLEDNFIRETHGAGWVKNKIFKIVHISNLDGSQHTECHAKIPIYWCSYNDGGHGVYETALELVKSYKKEIKKFGIAIFLESIERNK